MRVVSQISVMDKTKMKIFARLRGQNLMRRSATEGDLKVRLYPHPPPLGTHLRHFPPRSVVERHLVREAGPKGVGPRQKCYACSDVLWLSCGYCHRVGGTPVEDGVRHRPDQTSFVATTVGSRSWQDRR